MAGIRYFDCAPATPEMLSKDSAMQDLAIAANRTLAEVVFQFPLNHCAVSGFLVGTAKHKSLTQNPESWKTERIAGSSSHSTATR